MPAKKIYPDRTVERAAQAAGALTLCLWQIRGPENTQIAWIEALMIDGSVVLIQTLTTGGWAAYTALRVAMVRGESDQVIADVLARCGVTS